MNTMPTPGESDLHQVDLTKLEVPQLKELKQRMEQESGICQDSLRKLKFAQSKLVNSNDSIADITPDSKGKSIMVPLTSSMYVPGKLSDSNNFIVDIGTGYFVEKNGNDAKEYFKRKIEYVTEQMEKIQMILIQNSKIRDAIIDVLEMKMQAVVPAAQS